MLTVQTWNINNDVLEYIERTHTYLVNGVVVPSVTQFIKKHSVDKYKYVAPQLLDRSCQYGNSVHKEIEEFEKYKIDIPTSKELSNYKFLKKVFMFKSLENEIPIIIYDEHGRPLMAGRIDMIVEKNGMLGIVDIKTTSTLDKEYLAKQLSLYKLGYQQSYHKEVEFLSGLHIRADVRKMVDIKEDKNILKTLKEDFL
jgi:hypothetical protein|nr:MAG TPA_asm: Mitochondrial genome maintenance exonuclease 1, DNA complex, DNA exonuclease [Caudoviricetes sp.]